MTEQTGTEFGDQVKLAAEAYIYGYPLVYSMHEISMLPSGTSSIGPKTPYNTFHYARALFDPTNKFVSPNNDTLYVIAMCDVRQGPLVLHVPDAQGRYYVLQLVDAWSNNFAYIGKRATGTDEAQYLLVGPGYTGDAPDGMAAIHAPTGVFAIVGRVAVDGKTDLPAAHALQDQFTLTPLSVYQGGKAPTAVSGVPQADPGVEDDLKWWDEFRTGLAAFSPPAADAPYLAICEKLGLTAAESPYVKPDPTLAKVLMAGAEAGQAKIDELGKHASKPVNGWQNTLHLFDYNLDFFEVGTIDKPEWKIADRTTAYVTRAVVDRAGLWGNHGYEADYQLAWVDADGNPLSSENKYELCLTELPPVDAFWSLTMYNVPEFYLADNPINRYAIGDRTPGLQKNVDGSLSIYMQKDSPGPDKEANWLPTPDGAFRPVMRLYMPRQPVLDRTYVLPAIQKVG